MSEPFRFGVVADVQYADKDNGWNYAQTHERFYRSGLPELQLAVCEWNEAGVGLVLQLGDLIDGFNKRLGTTDAALADVANVLCETYRGRVLSMWGNHEAYNATRDDLRAMLMPQEEMAGAPFWYGSFEAAPGLRILMLDTLEVSAMTGVYGQRDWTETGADDCPERVRALAVLAERNPNEIKNSPQGLRGYDRRFVAFNGAVSETQLAWFAEQLALATAAGERVLVVSHCPVLAGGCDDRCLAWNYQEVFDLLEAHTCVVAYFSGHDHVGGYGVSPGGVHHWVLPAVLEGPGLHRWGTVAVHEDRFEIEGFAPTEEQWPREMAFRPL